MEERVISYSGLWKPEDPSLSEEKETVHSGLSPWDYLCIRRDKQQTPGLARGGSLFLCPVGLHFLFGVAGRVGFNPGTQKPEPAVLVYLRWGHKLHRDHFSI